MAAPVIPPPTAQLVMFAGRIQTTREVGVDLVCTPEGEIARVLVCARGGLFFRLEFTREQLAAMLDELVDLSDALDVQRDTLTASLSFGGC